MYDIFQFITGNDVMNTIESMEKSFALGILENSEDNLTSQAIKTIPLKILYFHENNFVIMVSDMYLSYGKVEVKQVSLDLIHRKVEFEAQFYFGQIDGILTKKHKDNASKKTNFRLVIAKILCQGIAITNGNINGPHVESLYVLSTNYVKPSFEVIFYIIFLL
uniref:Uncharacterized protein n=2 Tax=Clastoptera arizonana TaxID=38151 RepID=A0A1B6DZS4_9HEMI